MDFISNLGAEAANCILHHTEPDPIKIFDLDSGFKAGVLLEPYKRSVQKAIALRIIPVKHFNSKIKPLDIKIIKRYFKNRKRKRKSRSK